MGEIKLWKHQEQFVESTKNKPHYALFWEMGTGKSLSAIKFLETKIQKERRLFKTVILCPIVVVENWYREILKFSDIPSTRVHKLEGAGNERVRYFKKYIADTSGGNIIITNYEFLLNNNFMEALTAWGPEFIIYDESHKLKDIKAKRTKRSVTLSKLAQFRLILTGTPVLNSALDLFSQFLILDNGYSFGTNFFVFRQKYFVDKNAHMPKLHYFPNWQPKTNCVTEINKVIEHSSSSIKKIDCLDLPPLIKQKVFVDLSLEQQRVYDDMKKDLIAYVNGGACVAELAITKALRLQQIVSGYVPTEDIDGIKSVSELTDTPRIKALSELLETLTPNHKVIVWAVFKENYRAIRKLLCDLSIEYVELHGEVSATKRQPNIDCFTNNPKCRVLLGHPGSGGIGVNLTVADYSIFYTRDFSLEHNLQAESRNHRGGSEIHETVTRIDIVATKTIDEFVLERLDSKQCINENVIKDLAKYF